MNTYENMTNSELLTMLLDGELSGEQETQIYSALAEDPELQAQLEHQLAIKEVVKSDTEAFTPPLEATFNIFNKLGYAVPAGIPAMKSIWNKLFNRKVAVTTALLLLSTFTVTSILTNKSDEQIAQSSATNSNEVIAHNSDAIISQNDNSVEPEKVIEAKASKTVIPISKSSAIKEEVPANNAINLQVSNNQEIAEALVQAKNSEIILNFASMPIQNNSAYNFAFVNNSKFEYMRSRKDDVRYNSTFSLIDRNLNSLYFRAGINANSAATNNFNNFLIGYMRKWKNDFSFGVELGTESINRLFTDDFSNSLTTEAKQVVWGAVALRYESHNLTFAGISPFALARFGFGSDFNYMFGINTGLIRNFNSLPFSISAAFEYTNFQYTHLSNSYNFDKSGFTFGIHYNF